MFDCFDGDINGHNIYDSYDSEEPVGGNYTSPNWLVFINVKVKKLTDLAVLFEIFGRKKNSRKIEYVADVWIPKSQIRRYTEYTKDHDDNKQEFQLGLRCVYIKYWLFEKIKNKINKPEFSIGTSDAFRNFDERENEEYMGGHF